MNCYVRHGLDGADANLNERTRRMRDGQAAEEGEEQFTDNQFLRQLRADVEGVRRSRPSLPLSVRAQKTRRGRSAIRSEIAEAWLIETAANLNSFGKIKAAACVKPPQIPRGLPFAYPVSS